jgi:hypothetical protein
VRQVQLLVLTLITAAFAQTLPEPDTNEVFYALEDTLVPLEPPTGCMGKQGFRVLSGSAGKAFPKFPAGGLRCDSSRRRDWFHCEIASGHVSSRSERGLEPAKVGSQKEQARDVVNDWSRLTSGCFREEWTFRRLSAG